MSYYPYLAHGATLALVWFFAVNLVASALLTALAPSLVRRHRDSAAFWLAARLFPAVASLLFVGVLFVPSYLKYEPREYVEGFDLALAVLAIAALTLIVAGFARGAAAWRRAADRSRDWMRWARPTTFARSRLALNVVDTAQPMMALTGIVRPRLIVTRGLVDALTDAELAASVAHELGHHRAFDNLKRLLMRAAPDCLGWFGSARIFEREWAAAAERAADRAGAGTDAHDRCALASALVKVARLMPTGVPNAEPISTLVSGGDITARVRLLLGDASPKPPRSRPAVRLAAVSAVLIAALAYQPLLRAVHEATELIVRSTGAAW